MTLEIRAKGFNHHAFEIEVVGDRPPTVAELVACAKVIHPDCNWEFSTTQEHVNSTFESFHLRGRCEYRLGTQFSRKPTI